MRSVTPFDKVCGAGTNKFFVLKNINAYPLKNSRGIVIVVGKGHSAGLFIAHIGEKTFKIIVIRGNFTRNCICLKSLIWKIGKNVKCKAIVSQSISVKVVNMYIAVLMQTFPFGIKSV